MRAALLVVLMAAAAGAVYASGQDKPAFRAGVDAVQVPVSVRDGNRPVTGLSAGDFVLTDNDVAQEVQAMSVESLPIDVTLILDTSGSTTVIAERLAREVQQIARLLRPTDALRLLCIDTRVEELRPMTPVKATLDLGAIPRQNGYSSVHDALAVALMRAGAADRRHLVVAITDALDTMSLTTSDRVREVASRSEALLQIVMVRPPAVFRATRSFVRPRFNEQHILVLTEAAERTGGELRDRGLFSDPDPVAAFKKVFDDFRQSYVLRYAPRGVETAGWHELAVSLPKSPKFSIRARRGYPGS